MMRRALPLAALLALAGCAHNTGLYSWGGYDQLLYQSYKSPTEALAAREQLEAHIAGLETQHARVAPGLYAEVGTFCLQAGDRAAAKQWYARESQAWPESRPLMTTLIAHLDDRAARPAAPAAPGSASAPASTSPASAAVTPAAVPSAASSSAPVSAASSTGARP